MFVRYYLELPLPHERVEHALLGSPPEWVAALAGEAQQRGDGLLAEVGVGPLGARLGRRVAVQLGEPVRFPSMTSLPLTWEPLGLEGLLPQLKPTSRSARSARTEPSWPSAPATVRPSAPSGGRSTGCCCTAWPRRPSRTFWTGSARRSRTKL
jgi:hypothetical protein